MSGGAWIVVILAAVAIYAYETNGSDVVSSGSSGSGDDLISDLLAGITQAENVAASHNNPGGICGSYDSSGNCLGPATFPSLSDGVSAAEADITKILNSHPLMTLEQFVQKWTGISSGAAYDNYLSEMEDATGLDATDQVGGEPTTGNAGTPSY